MLRQLSIALLPALLFAAVALLSYQSATRVTPVDTYEELQPMGAGAEPAVRDAAQPGADADGLAKPEAQEGGWANRPATTAA